jgi:hypothetical protein
MRFWNTFHQVRSMSKDRQTKYYQSHWKQDIRLTQAKVPYILPFRHPYMTTAVKRHLNYNFCYCNSLNAVEENTELLNISYLICWYLIYCNTTKISNAFLESISSGTLDVRKTSFKLQFLLL